MSSHVVEAGDVILKVNGTDVHRYTTKEVLKCLRLSEQLVTLELKRDPKLKARIKEQLANTQSPHYVDIESPNIYDYHSSSTNSSPNHRPNAGGKGAATTPSQSGLRYKSPTHLPSLRQNSSPLLASGSTTTTTTATHTHSHSRNSSASSTKIKVVETSITTQQQTYQQQQQRDSINNSYNRKDSLTNDTLLMCEELEPDEEAEYVLEEDNKQQRHRQQQQRYRQQQNQQRYEYYQNEDELEEQEEVEEEREEDQTHYDITNIETYQSGVGRGDDDDSDRQCLVDDDDDDDAYDDEENDAGDEDYSTNSLGSGSAKQRLRALKQRTATRQQQRNRDAVDCAGRSGSGSSSTTVKSEAGGLGLDETSFSVPTSPISLSTPLIDKETANSVPTSPEPSSLVPESSSGAGAGAVVVRRHNGHVVRKCDAAGFRTSKSEDHLQQIQREGIAAVIPIDIDEDVNSSLNTLLDTRQDSEDSQSMATVIVNNSSLASNNNEGEQTDNRSSSSSNSSDNNNCSSNTGEPATNEEAGDLQQQRANNSALGNVGHNPFLDPPEMATAVEYKKGYVMRKCCYDSSFKKTPFGKRSWKMFYCTLRDLVLYLHKDEHGFRKSQMSDNLHNAIRIHHALATKANDYTKKQHVFRLQTADQAEYLFQTSDSKELQSWVETINYVCAAISAPPLEGGVGSQKRFQRPLLPSKQSKLMLKEQLDSHEVQLAQLDQELNEHKKGPIPSKGLALQNYKEKESYLQYELRRYRTYVSILSAKMLADQQQLELQAQHPSPASHEEEADTFPVGTTACTPPTPQSINQKDQQKEQQQQPTNRYSQQQRPSGSSSSSSAHVQQDIG
ncbi:GD20966 [Drosophila simulans]|uniref:GD20966 n=1 Tax=Drosophila simulans TaxID=7240 RepID=B4R0N0_DROSI|nr:GD20966 [Drosophila simulans]